MIRLFARVTVAIALTMAVAASAHANDWIDYMTVSMTNPTTPKLTAKNLCYTDGTDLLCDGAAGQYSTSGTVIYSGVATGGLTVTGNSNLANVSATSLQISTNSATCATGISGTMRYSAVSSTMEYCNGSAWTSMGPSSTQPVSFAVTKGGTNQTVTTNTEATLTWSSKDFDTNNNFSTGTGRFTPTVPGKYLIGLNAYCTDSTTFCVARIYKNGIEVGESGSSPTNGSEPHTTALVDMNGTTDYVEARAYNGGGTTIGGGGSNTHFYGTIIGPQGNGGGGATPAGSTNDIQYNSGGALGADTGKFTYASGLLTVSGTTATVSTSRLYASTASLTTLYVGGVAITGSSSGDRITSGTASAIANSNSGYISLTTGATTWGYVGSSATYLPVLNGASAGFTGNVSASIVSVTALQIVSQSTTFTCASGNAGTLRYNSPTLSLELCTGSGWQPMGVGIPAGTISAFASTTCPTGWSEYTAARGRFLRGIDNAAGNDADGTRSPGATQADAFQGHVFNSAFNNFLTNTNFVAGASSEVLQGSGSPGSNFASQAVSDGTNGTPRISSETRPKNVAVTFCQFNGTSNGWNNPLSGGGGGATPAGSSGDVQYNSGGSLAADTGNFTYASGKLTVGKISTTGVISATGGYFQGAVQVGGTGSESCSSAADYGKMRVNPTTHHMQLCK